MQQPFYFNPYENNQNPQSTTPNSQNTNIPYSMPQQDHFLQDLARKKQEKAIMKLGFMLGGSVVGVILVQLLATMFLLHGENAALYESNHIFYTCFNIIGSSVLSITLPFGIMALINRKKYKAPIIPLEPIGKGQTFLHLCVGMLACMVSNIIVNVISLIGEEMGYQLTVPEGPAINSVFGCVLTIIGVAIVPALCEEFALRCCALGIAVNQGKAFGVVAVSIIFGLLHGNVVQFVFATLIGLIMGYITVKTNSVLPAILIHGCNNGLSAVYDVLEFAFNEKTADDVTNVLIIIWIVLGVAATIYMATKHQLFVKKQPKHPDDVLSLGMKLVYLLPGTVLPLLYFVASTITSINKL